MLIQAGYLDGSSNSGQVAGPSTSPSPGSSEIGQHTSSSSASSMTVLPGGGASGGGGGQASAIYAKIGGGSYSVPTPIDGKSLREPLVHPDIYTNHQRTKTKLVQQNICIQNHVSLNFPLQEKMERCTHLRG